MITRERFALNRIIFPQGPLKDFIDIAVKCGTAHIELRNDLGNRDIIDSMVASKLKQVCEETGIEIISINAIQKFNLPSNFLKAQEEIKQISALCTEIGCEVIVLCPTNDLSDKRTMDEFLLDTIDALKLYAPIFEKYKLLAYIEPLGFPECSIRTKRNAINAIQASGYPEIYRIVHDTFHHFLGPDDRYYPDETGLVHISGVENALSCATFRDKHRVLINKKDIMETREQIHILEDNGYKGLYSFEPFAASVQQMTKPDLIKAVNESLDYLIN